MNEEDINWVYVKNEIVSKGCRVNDAFGPFIFESNYKTSTSLDYSDLLSVNNENLLTKSYLEYSKKKKTYWYDTLKPNSRYSESNLNKNLTPFITRNKMKRFEGSELELRKKLKELREKQNDESCSLADCEVDLLEDKFNDLIFMGSKCKLYIENILTSRYEYKIDSDKKDALILATKEAHKYLSQFIEYIITSNSLELKDEQMIWLNNKIFQGFYLILLNIDTINHRRFALVAHLNRCSNENCPTGFFISHHKNVDSSCSPDCSSHINNSVNSPIYKKKT